MDNSPFAALAPELRKPIWELSLGLGEPIMLKNRKSAVPPAITQTCRQIRGETLQAFYHDRTVVLDLPSLNGPTHAWLDDVAVHRLVRDTTRWLELADLDCRALIAAFEVHASLVRGGSRCVNGDCYFWEAMLIEFLPDLSQALISHGYCGARQPLFVYTRVGAPETGSRSLPRWDEWVEKAGFRFALNDLTLP